MLYTMYYGDFWDGLFRVYHILIHCILCIVKLFKYITSWSQESFVNFAHYGTVQAMFSWEPELPPAASCSFACWSC